MYNLLKVKSKISDIGCVASLVDINVIENKILNIRFENINHGLLSLKLLTKDKLDDLYEFYYQGLNEISRKLWPPYPLFKPELKSKNELHTRYNQWLKEDDWFFWVLCNNDIVIGASLLKKLSWKDDETSEYRAPTSGLAVAEKYKKQGFGFLLQKVIEYQAFLYGAKKIFATIEENNIASIKVHKKSGFIETERVFPRYNNINGEKVFDTNIIEYFLKVDLLS